MPYAESLRPPAGESNRLRGIMIRERKVSGGTDSLIGREIVQCAQSLCRLVAAREASLKNDAGP